MLGELIIVIIVIIVIMIIIVIINMMIRCDCNDGWEGRRCERKVFELDALLVFSILSYFHLIIFSSPNIFIMLTSYHCISSCHDYPTNDIDKVEDHAAARIDGEDHCSKYKVYIIIINHHHVMPSSLITNHIQESLS